MSRVGLSIALSWVVACAAEPRSMRPADPGPTVPAVSTSVASASAAPPAESSSPPPPESKAKPHRVSFALEKDSEPCTLVITGELSEHADVWLLRDVTRIEAEPCERMQPHLLFDGTQPGAGHDKPLSSIPVILWTKPGRSLPAELPDGLATFSNGLQDLDADGRLDVCGALDSMVGVFNICWVFDPTKRVFVYHPELSEIAHMRVENGKLGGWRHAGHVHEGLEYAWVDGKAELVRRSTELAGADADGVPTPGRTTLVVEQLRGGKVVKTSRRVVPYDPDR